MYLSDLGIGHAFEKRMKSRMLSLLFVSSLAFGATPKLSPEFEHVDPNSTVDVIVQYKQAPGPNQFERIRNNHGGQLRHALNLVRAGAFSGIPVSHLSEIANDPEVEYVSLDNRVTGALDNTAGAVNAAAAWSKGLTGVGVGVAIIDSGIAAEYSYGAAYSQSFVAGNSSPADQYGHGTHVFGIIGIPTTSDGGRTFTGIANQAARINLRVLDQNGDGTDSAVIAAIEKAIALKSTYNIRVINLSLGRPVTQSYKTDPLCQAVEAAWKAGIVVVVAAGNNGRDNTYGEDGYGTITAPGNDPYVITVGAMKSMNTPTRTDDQIASYSSKGPTSIDHIVKPDLVAPGNQVISAYAPGAYLETTYPANDPVLGGSVSPYFFTLSGTSMATPVVSSAVALLLQQNPTLTPDQVKARLMKTAYKTFPVSSTATDPTTGIQYTSYYDLFTVGAGYLDISQAILNTDTGSGAALSPTASYNATTKAVTLSGVTGSNVIWGSNLVWGTNLIWGTSVLSGSNVIWGTNVIWGAGTAVATNVIWGTNIIWGTSVPQGETSTIAIYGER
jgi:serine protease AprX